MSIIDDLEKLQKLKEQGILTEAEFENEKKKILKKDVKVEKVTNNTEEKINNVEKNIINKDIKKQDNNKNIQKNKKKFCIKCGNEIYEGEKFCGKCGYKVDKEYGKIIKSKFKKQYIIIVIIFIIMVLSIILVSNKKEKTNEINEPVIESNKTNTSTTENNKEYYDFIDTKYYTFKVTENELINLLLGNSYTALGYTKSVSQNDNNTVLYTKMIADYSTSTTGIESISITTSPSNLKVKEFNISFFANNYLTENQMVELSRGYLILGTSCLKGKNVNDMNEEERVELEQTGKDLSEDRYSGLDYTCVRDTKKVQCIFKATI